MNFVLLPGDCLEVLKTLPDNSLDSMVTDPPAGIAFMGKDWDKDKGGRTEWIAWMRDVMRECLRVMKPGAHGLVWALPRTSHWTATALEDAGFQVRDVITHHFGSGFPKSLDVSKAIDKAAGAQREVISTRKLTGKARVLKGGNFDGDYAITAPATDAAKQWAGFGTALKPASEYWVLIRKPLSEETVAKNVLKWGTGALNIDASRIGSGGHHGGAIGASQSVAFGKHVGYTPGPHKIYTQGRFPANLVFSHTPYCTDGTCDIECAARLLDDQSGTLKSGATKAGQPQGTNFSQSHVRVAQYDKPASSGGASRFFYCAKASKRDRGEGNTHPTVKSTALMTYLIRMVTPPGGTVLDPFAGSGSTGVAALSSGFTFLGIEQSPEYFEIAETRLNAA